METIINHVAQDQSNLAAANMSLAAIAASLLLPTGIWPSSSWGGRAHAQELAYEIRALPDKAQIIDQREFNVLDVVPPPNEANATTVGDGTDMKLI